MFDDTQAQYTLKSQQHSNSSCVCQHPESISQAQNQLYGLPCHHQEEHSRALNLYELYEAYDSSEDTQAQLLFPTRSCDEPANPILDYHL
ncbi:hypothetical protein HanRHA438_Chr09g0423441 [Helianthus annuus]|nr:hypothetical protein HanRHA438_Chr09g0423441 [Helianthus annuus]